MTEDIATLWAAVAHVAQDRVAVVELAVQAVEQGSAERGERCARAVEEAHKLVGSLDSYGRTGGSGLALQLAVLLEQDEPEAPEARRLVDLLRAKVS